MSVSELSPLHEQLLTAAEHLMVHLDFQKTLDVCNKGLESLSSEETQDSRCAELKAGFCTLGIQALAEMNQWPGVLSWLQQQYQPSTEIPARLIQMCILLYAKVCEPGLMLQQVRLWLLCPANRGSPGFRTVVELHVLHVLVPLGLTDEARELITGDVGRALFTDEQRRAALDVLDEREREDVEKRAQDQRDEVTERPGPTAVQRLENLLRFLSRKFSTAGSGSFPVRKVFLALVLLYMLFFRLDPAQSSAFLWISKLLQLLKQTWVAMFAPHYQAVAQSKGL
ncbi:peroxisome assembly protein 26 [Gouania willdenowi]|uniref:Peroxisome assembly protein 26 n=1 Tax=Gouania willdenowi TaxID=441366 RepID=A0A8C5DRK6_GOUWI|nr:peroxisome assembly protein 26 [Gouania willdenowi]